MANTKIHKAKCRYCGKPFESLYKRQLEFNHALHEATCKKRNSKEEKDGKS
jgi:hypothetical protein